MSRQYFERKIWISFPLPGMVIRTGCWVADKDWSVPGGAVPVGDHALEGGGGLGLADRPGVAGGGGRHAHDMGLSPRVRAGRRLPGDAVPAHDARGVAGTAAGG